VFNEIFLQETYRFPSIEPPQSIIDCGSNIGLSILFFKTLFPHCAITAIEAFPDTFRMLEENIRVNNMANVTALNCALAASHGRLPFFSRPGALRGSLNRDRGPGEPVFVRSMPLSELIVNEVDLLKIDIEGSEVMVFQDLEQSGKLSLVRSMLIEYHHHLPSEPHNLSCFLNRLERNGFSYDIAASAPSKPGAYQDIAIRAFRSRPLTSDTVVSSN
jgi:FkbM family methyltransferase